MFRNCLSFRNFQMWQKNMVCGDVGSMDWNRTGWKGTGTDTNTKQQWNGPERNIKIDLCRTPALFGKLESVVPHPSRLKLLDFNCISVLLFLLLSLRPPPSKKDTRMTVNTRQLEPQNPSRPEKNRQNTDNTRQLEPQDPSRPEMNKHNTYKKSKQYPKAGAPGSLDAWKEQQKRTDDTQQPEPKHVSRPERNDSNNRQHPTAVAPGSIETRQEQTKRTDNA